MLLVAVALAACSTTIRDLNLRPEKHYQQKVTVVGYITRMQSVGGETLMELTGDRDSRVLIRAPGLVDVHVGDWVKVTGVFVPDARVAETNIYDVLTAEEISKTGGPWLPDIK